MPIARSLPVALAVLVTGLFVGAGQAKADSGVIAQGMYHGCGITITTEIKCWGDNAVGQLGNSTYSDSPSPVSGAGVPTGATAVTAGLNFSCAIVSGAAKCWGASTSGQIGDGGMTFNPNSPEQVTGMTTGVSAIGAGMYHACAVVSGAAQCWGEGSSGQLGNGSGALSGVPVAVSGLTSGVTAVAAGADFSCALQSGAVKCWGANFAGQLGDGSNDASSTPVQVAGLTSGVTAISAGDAHACAIQSGAVKCWGFNGSRQLGDGTSNDANTPQQASGLTGGVTRVTTGASHTCALLSGSVVCWGSAGMGQVGTGFNPSTYSTAQAVTGLSGAISVIAAGGETSCAVAEGSPFCWGLNEDGQVGNGSSLNESAPVQVQSAVSGTTTISAAPDHACAVIGGVGRCWGSDTSEQLGTGAGTASTTTPVTPVGLEADTTAISAGDQHSCAIVSGVAKCWGFNGNGRLGTGGTTNRAIPYDVFFAEPETATAIDAGAASTCGIFSGGAVYCWGADTNGALGNGAAGNTSSPTAPAVVTGASAVSVGTNHACAIVSGAVSCWGAGSSGQLGNGVFDDSQTPVSVSGIASGATAVYAGNGFTCATVSGAARCWGANGISQLGNGGTSNSSVPVSVTGIASGATAIAAASGHACGVQSGAAKCWGSNAFGNLGDGTFNDATAPVSVAGLSSGVTAVTASSGGFSQYSCAIQTGAAKCWGRRTNGVLGDGNGTFEAAPEPVIGYVPFAPDTTAPVLSNVSPVDGSSTQASSVSLTYTVTDNADLSPSCTPSSGTNVPLSPGVNTIDIDCTDASNNTSEYSISVTRDNAAPVVTITAPVNNLQTQASTVAVTYTVSDDFDSAPSCSAASGSSHPLGPDSNTLTVTCTDDAGNSGSASRTVIRDDNGPVISVSAPVDNLQTQATSTTLTYTVTDDHDATPSCDVPTGSSHPLSVGNNTISVTCTDDAGNSSSVNRNVIRDVGAPAIVITSPADNLQTQSSSVVLTYTVTDDNDASPGCNQASGSSQSLVAGSNSISVTCTDDAGNSSTATRTVFRDNTGPVIDVTAPAEGLVTQSASTTLTYTVSDDFDASPSCDKASGSSHSLVSGPNSVAVTCTDDAGNSTTVTRSVVRDTVSPLISITAPADNLHTQAANTTLTYMVSDDVDPSPSCDKSSGSSQPLSPGSNTISVTCTDDGGNSSTASRTVIRDNTAPEITLTAPANNLNTQAASTTLAYSVSDNFDAAPSCDKANGSSQPLAAGSNTISVTCTDDAGNSSTVSRTVVRDNAAPSINVTAPSDGLVTAATSVTLSYTVGDDFDVSPSCDKTSGSSQSLVGGTNTISVTCSDDAGNSSTVSRSVTRDASNPAVVITAPADGVSTSANSIAVSFSVSDDVDASPACDHTSGASMALALGANTLTVSCTDDFGHIGTATVNVTRVPDAPPNVAITNPVNGLATQSASVTLTFTASDDNGTPSCDKTSGASQSLVAGANTISVTCTDSASQSTTASVTVTRDNTPPTVTVSAPVNNLHTQSANVILSYTVVDAIDPTPTCDTADGSIHALSSGSNTVSVTCSDDAGNSSTVSRTVIRDNTPPNITVSSPTDGLVTDSASVTLTYSVSDALDTTPSCDKASGSSQPLFGGGNTVSVTCSDDAGNSSTVSRSVTRDAADPVVSITAPSTGITTSAATIAVSFTVSDDVDASPTCDHSSGANKALAIGANTLTVSCQDDFGHVGSASVSVTRVVDAPPSVSITSPANGLVTQATSVTLNYTASDDGGAPTCDKANGSSQALAAGANTISVTCTDGSSQSTTASVSVTRDNTAPVLTVSSPVNNLQTQASNVTLNYSVSDNFDASPSCDKVNGSGQPLTTGSNTISVTCSDDAGNSSTVSRTVIRDNAPPTITVTSPVDGFATTATSVALAYTVSDNHDASPSCDKVNGSSQPLFTGANTISVTCSDDAGNSSTVSRTVTRDNTPPSVSISAPANGASTTAASVSVTFTATDALDAAPSCDRTSGDSVALAIGPNTITVNCTDDAGNTGTASVSVTRSTDVAPVVSITSPANGLSTQSATVTLNYTATDDTGTPSCDKADGSSQSLAPGANTISVTCTDSASQSTTASVSVTRDNAAPSISVSAPADNLNTQAASVVLSYTVSDDLDATPNCDKVSGSSQPLIAGSNTVSVTCSDDAGNSATVNRTVVRDNTLPVVNITSPTDGSTTTDTSAIVTFTASDNSGAQTCSRTSGDEVPLTVGLNSITVTCVDAAGNTNSSSVNVTRYSTGPDTTAPDVDVIAPANGSTTSAASVVLAYTVLDDQDASPECTPASGDTVPLNVGVNTIAIVCTDDAANQSTTELTVTREAAGSVDPPPPPTVPPAQLQSRVTPSLIFTRKAKVKGKKATVTARVWFMTPAGRAKELPCAGVVLGTTKPSGVRKALKSSKSLKAEGAACIADLSFKLPKKNVGKKIAIKLSFAGNPVLAPFSRTVKYKVK